MSRDTLASVRSRRAVGLLVFGTVLPGSAQLIVGNRTVGKWALRIWGLLLFLLLLAGVGLLLFREPLIAFVLTDNVATTLRAVAWFVFGSWALLLLDAWRLGRPPQLRRRVRLGLTVASITLVAAAGFGTTLVASAFTAVDIGAEVFQGGGEEEADERGRYNVLLLGVDAADGREGLRPDSINVASIDEETGRTVLLGLPRNLQKVQFPRESPLRDLYPRGFACDGGQCMLNGIYTLGVDNADLYDDDVADPGIQAMKEAVSHTLGLSVNYYVMVDMAGFTDLVDALGGIRVNVHKAVPIGGVTHPVTGHIGPGEKLHLDGFEALWLVRSRHDSSDYERMTRQKCVMNAMVQQLEPLNVATRFVDLSRAGANLVSTDIGRGHVAELTDLALKAKGLPLESVDFVPPMIVAADPDFTLIRNHVAETLAASKALDDPQPTTAPTTAAPTETGEPTEPAGPAQPAGPTTSASPTAPQTGTAEPGDQGPEAVEVCSVG